MSEEQNPETRKEVSPPALEELSFEDFESRVESSFRLPEAGIELVLEEASKMGSAPKPGSRIQRQAFSLLFHGPAEPLLDQGIRRLEHDELGAQDLFLVPVGDAEDGGFLYEAVFT